ncbi:uncharacterized protein LOC106957481 [Poecilia latipinna]|uniref:uncharacterized protein LOC106957481 n=1 Tax=Poecilia latipinna TaxID=48699 RepID=UPI00072E2E49|nr:PREDICTED: uncharacterized protein LOC106957481 [Poecilia latipinna]
MEEFQMSTLKDLLHYNGKRDYLELVSKFVSENRLKEISLCRPVGAKLIIGPVEDTEYDDSPAVVNGWGKFYLPKTTEMKVIGYAKGTLYPCDQLVLMTCEKKKVYGFDGEDLHLVAFSLDQMLTKGIADPALQSFYRGEPFKDVTKEDWEEVKQSPVGKKLDEEHRQLVASHISTILQNLNIIRSKQRRHQENGNILPKSNVTQLQKVGV